MSFATILVHTRCGVWTESGPKKYGFSQKIKVRTFRTKVRTQTDLQKLNKRSNILYRYWAHRVSFCFYSCSNINYKQGAFFWINYVQGVPTQHFFGERTDMLCESYFSTKVWGKLLERSTFWAFFSRSHMMPKHLAYQFHIR